MFVLVAAVGVLAVVTVVVMTIIFAFKKGEAVQHNYSNIVTPLEVCLYNVSIPSFTCN